MEPSSRISAILLSAAISATAVALCVIFAEFLDRCGIAVPYLSFIPAIVGCCAFGGWALASWALVFSALGLWFFFLPPTGTPWPEYGDAAHLVVFIAVSYFVCWVIDGQRRANDVLLRDNVALGCKISVLLGRAKAR